VGDEHRGARPALRGNALADGLVPEYAHELGPCTKIKIVSDKATEIYAGSH
jgi:hypothetical protein